MKIMSLKHKDAVASGKVLSTQKIQKYCEFHFSKTELICETLSPFFLVGFFLKQKAISGLVRLLFEAV